MPLRPYQQGGADPTPLQRYFEEADVAMERMYSAWSAFMEQRNRPVPDWETYARHIANAPGLNDELLQEDPQLLATDPLFIPSDWSRSEIRNRTEDADIIDQFLQAEEFVPESMREGYIRLRDMYRGIYQEMVSAQRAATWLRSLEQEDPARELLSRPNTDGMTPAEAEFYNTFRNYRTEVENTLSGDMIGKYGVHGRSMALIGGTELLRYALGNEWVRRGENSPVRLLDREHPNASDILVGFDSVERDSTGMIGYVTYTLAQRAGIDPESLIEFVEEMRTEVIRERRADPAESERVWREGNADAAAYLAAWRESRGYNEAIMHFAARREEDADEIVRFSRNLTEELGGAELSSDEAGRRLRDRLGNLSENARETLTANFDRTFGKYFPAEQLGDGTAFSHIRAGEASLSDLIQNYGGDPLHGDQTPQAVRMAKAELVARVMAGEPVEVERVLSDGTVRRVPLRMETSQHVLEEVLENADRARRERAGIRRMAEDISRQPLEQRQAGIHQMFENTYRAGRSGMPYLDQSGAEAEIRGWMRQDAQTALAREGIFEPSADSVLGAGEVADLHRALRELSVYRASLPAEQAGEYDRYLRILQGCAENLNQLRSDQELIRAYPALQDAGSAGGPRDPRLRGWSLDTDLMEKEAEKLYQAGTALAQALRYGMGEGGPADGDRIWNGGSRQALQEILEAEGSGTRQLQEMTDRLRREAPAAGSRFADAETIPVDIAAAGEEMVGLFRPGRRPQEGSRTQEGNRPREPRPWENEVNVALLGPEARQYAAQNFDTVMGPVFGPAEREELASRGMDIYDHIFVDGRSLSDLYRQTPERRPYERMESDMKCHFLENVLAGRRIDVMVTDAAGKAALRRLLPYDSSGRLAASRVLSEGGISFPRNAQHQAAGQEEEDRIRSAVDESRQRLENTLADPAALQNRKEYIRYGQGNGAPAREGFAEPLRGRWSETVLPAKLPLDETKEWNAGQREALSALWSMQMHEQGTRSNGSLTNRLRVSGDPASVENQRVRQALDVTDEMFTNLLRTTGADRLDPQLMGKMGLRAPEQLFYIEGKPAEEYLREMPEYADLTPDYKPDSEYMRVLRGEIISATMGNVSPVDLAMPEEDGFGIRPRVRELHVDYKSDLMKWQYTGSDNTEISVDLGERQRRQWESGPEETEGLDQEYIYPVSEAARSSRQSQVVGELRRNHMPRIWLAGSQDGELSPQQRERIQALRRYRPADRQPMDERLRDVANTLYGEISRQLGLGEQEKSLLTDTGVIASEAEMFYINGMPALDYVRQNVSSLRNLQKDTPDFDRILKAEVAAAAVSGHTMVEVGRVMTDQRGNLRAAVTDVHVDLEPVRLSSDITIPEPNTYLRDPRWDSDRAGRRINIREDMQARIDRAGAIRYASGNNVAYSAAARRFDLGGRI